MKRNSLADSCQNVRRDMNISDQPSAVSSSTLIPTDESSVVIRPIRSSFCMRYLPRSTPSLLIFMRHSPLGRASFGVSFDSSVVRNCSGSFKWKYQYRVAQSIIAISRVGLVEAWKSLGLGFDIIEITRLSLRRVGFLKGWIW